MKKLNKTLVTIASLTPVVFLGACSSLRCIPASDEVVSVTREVTDFDSISFEWYGNIYLTQSDTTRVEIKTSDNVLPTLETTVKNKKLTIKKKLGTKRVCEAPVLDIYISTPNIQELALAWAGKIQGESKIVSDDLSVDVDGSGELVLDISAKSFDLDTAGSAKITIAGSVDTQMIDVAGSSKISNFDLQSKETKIRVSGSANIQVNTSDLLDVDVSGSADISYMWNPELTQNIDGSANIQQK